MKKSHLFCGICSVVVLAATVPAHAQQSSDPQQIQDSNSADKNLKSETQLTEIVVTAEKRSQTANNIGMAIAAFSGDTLKQNDITDIEQLTSVVPGCCGRQITAV